MTASFQRASSRRSGEGGVGSGSKARVIDVLRGERRHCTTSTTSRPVFLCISARPHVSCMYHLQEMRSVMRQTMDSSIICAWLKITSSQWPPDRYTLLGVDRTEPDLAEIERQVQQRLEQVRRYQLIHPDA